VCAEGGGYAYDESEWGAGRVGSSGLPYQECGCHLYINQRQRASTNNSRLVEAWWRPALTKGRLH